MSQKIQFLVLPYVNFRQNFSFNKFRIWQNTPENWKINFEFDNTKFLDRFLDDKGLPLSKNIYIIATNSSSIPYQKWERLIHTLFYLTFGFPNVTADDFYFEVWDWDLTSAGEGYTKHDKFSKTIVAPGTKVKIYPDQYIRYNSLKSIDPSSNQYKFFQNLFQTDYNSYLLRSISYYFKTQYRNIAHFSELDDILNYCSAFQTFLQVYERRDLGKIIANKLSRIFKIENKTQNKIEEWMITFYDIRSKFTHGSTVSYEDLSYNNIRHIDIAGKVFQALVMRQYNSGFEDLIDAPIVDIFESQEIFESIIHLLSKAKVKEHIFNCNANELRRIRNLFFDLKLVTNTNYISYDNKRKLISALKSILYIYGQLFKVYLTDDEKAKEYDVEHLRKIKRILDGNEEFEVKLDRLPNTYLDAQEKEQTHKEVLLREKIPLGHIFEAYGKILEIYRR